MKKFRTLTKIGMLATVTALALGLAACSPSTGDENPAEPVSAETYSLSITNTSFANSGDSGRSKDADGNFIAQAQFSILDTKKTLPVSGDKIKVTFTGSTDTAIAGTSGGTYAYLASSTDGKLQSGADNNWWTVLSDYAELTIDGSTVSLDHEFTLTDGCPEKSTIQWASPENALMLVIGYADADENNVGTETLTFESFSVVNNKQ